MKAFFKLFQAVFFLTLITFAISCSDDEETPKVDCTTSDLAATATGTDVSCASQGSVTASSTGGTGTVQYSIDETNFQASGVFEDLSAGNYTVTAKDTNGCTSTATVSVSGDAASSVAFTTSEVDSGCGGSQGSITVTASGGNGTYEYSIDGGSFGSSNIFAGLAQGSHSITVKDSDDCDNSSDVSISAGTSLSADIAPIITQNCAVTGCHVAGSISPNLSTNAGILAKANRIMARTGAGSMPPSGALSSVDVAAIACWVNDGGLDN